MLPPKAVLLPVSKLVSQAWCLGSGPSAVGSGYCPLVSTTCRGRPVRHSAKVLGQEPVRAPGRAGRPEGPAEKGMKGEEMPAICFQDSLCMTFP